MEEVGRATPGSQDDRVVPDQLKGRLGNEGDSGGEVYEGEEDVSRFRRREMEEQSPAGEEDDVLEKCVRVSREEVPHRG